MNDVTKHIPTALAQHALGLDPEFEDVKDFHVKFHQLVGEQPRMLTRRKLLERVRFLQEELDELKKAETLADMFDALLDLVYVAKGTAVMMGLPWREGWIEVQTKNMQKIVKETHRGNRVDVGKPAGWTPPDHLPFLEVRGWVHGTCPWQTVQGLGMQVVPQALADDQTHLEDGTAWEVDEKDEPQ